MGRAATAPLYANCGRARSPGYGEVDHASLDQAAQLKQMAPRACFPSAAANPATTVYPLRFALSRCRRRSAVACESRIASGRLCLGPGDDPRRVFSWLIGYSFS
jgi:hypothetical protein